MSDDALRELARQAGIATDWHDASGKHRTVSPEVLRALLKTLDLPCDSDDQIAESREALGGGDSELLPPRVTGQAGKPTPIPGTGADRYRLVLESGETREGTAEQDENGRAVLPGMDETGYHRLELGGIETTLAIAPRSCFRVADAAGRDDARLWGLAVQLYSLRSADDLGVGDFSALADFARSAGEHGASAVVVSPVHALFSADPGKYSPYAPSSRTAINVLHVDPAAFAGAEAVAREADGLGLADEFARLRQAELVDWPAMARAKLALLRRLFDAAGRGSGPGEDLAGFRARGGAALGNHARFEALHRHFFGGDAPLWNWRDWPQPYRDPGSKEVERFSRENADEVDFAVFLQWLADRGLAEAHAAARDSGMPVGLISDLAIGVDSGGSQAWSRQEELLIGASIGAPPDLFNQLGQSWGLAALSPRALRRTGFAVFLDMLRANLAHAGGIRIDHIMGLQRLWLVPEGASASDGAYIRYPFEDLLNLTALESTRHRAIVIGEDLGTVPEGLRDVLAERGVLGTRVLWFERYEEGFLAPHYWAPEVIATTTTHDLPTVAGWWKGRDIDWRARLSLTGEEESEADLRAQRARQREELWAAFGHEDLAGGAPPAEDDPEPVIDAAFDFVAATRAPLAVLPLEDVLGLPEQPNLPGTVDEHPNWRRRLDKSAGEVLDAPPATGRLDRLNRVRSRR